MRFDGDVAIVTGAGSGIGRAVSQRLASEGAAVACLDVEEDAARASASLIADAGGRALALASDVRDRSGVENALASTREEFGKVTHLANVAGTNMPQHGFDTLTDDAWDIVLDINAKGAFIVSQVIAPAIADAGGGAMVMISSVDGVISVSKLPHYSASKAAVAMLTREMAVSLADRKIRVNAVAPGPVGTPLLLDLLDESPEFRELVEQRTLLRRVARPEEIAGAVAFLLSEDASYMTGLNVHVDGGWSAH